jgi:hypothetical protein
MDLLISSTVLVALAVWYHVRFTSGILMVIPIVLVLAAFALPVALTLSALHVRFRDIGMALPMGLQQRLIKTGGRLVKHARYYWLLLAESHLTRRLFRSTLRRIWALPCRPADGRWRQETVWAKRGRETGEVSEKCERQRVRRPECRSLHRWS